MGTPLPGNVWVETTVCDTLSHGLSHLFHQSGGQGSLEFRPPERDQPGSATTRTGLRAEVRHLSGGHRRGNQRDCAPNVVPRVVQVGCVTIQRESLPGVDTVPSLVAVNSKCTVRDQGRFGKRLWGIFTLISAEGPILKRVFCSVALRYPIQMHCAVAKSRI